MAERTWRTAGLDEPAARALMEELPASEVWSLLLEVLARRAGQRTPADLMRQWERDGFTRPGAVDQRTLNDLDRHLLAAASAFEAIELSPLAPLGACSVVAPASQNKVVSALRGTEIVSDPTNVMALESARRLRGDPAHIVRLATCHRCVRAQAVPKGAGFAQHFRIFCLSTAGRERQGHALLVEASIEHIQTHLRALDRLEQHGYAFGARRLTLLATEDRGTQADRIAAAFPAAAIERRPLTHRYYDGLRFMIDAGDGEGSIPLIDGGAFDWVAQLAGNRRLAFVASGMGAQLAAVRFCRSAPSA